MTSEIIWVGNISPEDLKISYIPEKYEIEEKYVGLVQELWEKDLKIAKKEGWKIFNGVIYMLLDYKGTNDSLNFVLQESDFKTVNSFKDLDLPSKRLAIGGFIQTLDGYYVFGHLSIKRSDHEAHSIIGGYVDGKQEKSNIGLLNNLLAELNEECGVDVSDIESLKYKSLFETTPKQYTFLADIKLKLNKDELIQKFTNSYDGEMQDLIFVKRSELIEFMNKKIPHLRNISAELFEIFK